MAHELADLYLRLSLDREGKTAIERQDADCTAWCERQGIRVRTRHIDRGRSGYKRRTKRAAFTEAIRAATSGEVSTLVVWKLDRLSRQGIGQVGLVLDQLELVGSRIVFVVDGLDSSVSGHRSVIAFLAERARDESETLSFRVKNAKDHLRPAGGWLGGPLPYGLRSGKNGLERDPTTAPVIRDIVSRYLGGLSMVKIARALNSEGVKPSRGEQWTAGTIAQILKSPTLAGLMPISTTRVDPETGETVYTGDIQPYRDPETGDVVEILDEDERLISPTERQLILKRIAERTTPTWKGVRPKRKPTALLTGLVYCECGARMSASGSSYVCGSKRSGGHCPGASAMVEVLDRYVVGQWFDRLSGATFDPDNPDPFLIAVAERWGRYTDPAGANERDELEARIADAEARLSDLEAARYERGEFSDPGGTDRYARLHEKVSGALVTLVKRRADLGPGALDIGGFLEPELVLEAWESQGDNDERRELLRLAFERVEVKKARGRGYRFKPDERVNLVPVGYDAD